MFIKYYQNPYFMDNSCTSYGNEQKAYSGYLRQGFKIGYYVGLMASLCIALGYYIIPSRVEKDFSAESEAKQEQTIERTCQEVRIIPRSRKGFKSIELKESKFDAEEIDFLKNDVNRLLTTLPEIYQETAQELSLYLVDTDKISQFCSGMAAGGCFKFETNTIIH